MQIDNVSEQIRSFLVAHFPLIRKRRINNDDHLLESGILDSLGVLELVAYLEEEFNISVADEDLVPENFQSISRLSHYVLQKGNSTRDSSPVIPSVSRS